MIVTRFAPSNTNPNGAGLHVGGLRTALYNYVFAKRNKGKFYVRLEDTDEQRSNEPCLKSLVKDLEWAGIIPDSGFRTDGDDIEEFDNNNVGPMRQSVRKEIGIYDKFARSLLDCGRAYKKDDSIVFQIPKEDIFVPDVILGPVKFAANQLSDFVIVKSSGMPTYHFAVVVDDYKMGVNHIIRGQEHLQNTWKHIALQKALGFPQPIYAHIPLIMNQDGSKMSKRQEFGQVNTEDFRKEGYLPWPLLNYIALLGWAPGKNVEQFDLNFLIENFWLTNIGKANARFDYKKLERFNSAFIKALSPKDFEKEFCTYGINFYPETLKKIELMGCLTDVCEMYHQRSKTLKFAFDNIRAWIDTPKAYDAASVELIRDKNGVEHLRNIKGVLLNINDWVAPNIKNHIDLYAKSVQCPAGIVHQPVRFSITGLLVSPEVDKVMQIIGKDESITRIENFCNIKIDMVTNL